MKANAAMPYKPAVRPRFDRVLSTLAKTAKRTANERVERFAHETRDGFVKAIEDQDFESFSNNPLSPSWIARKLKAHADPRVHIATGEYTGNIDVFVHPYGSHRTDYGVGFDTSKMSVTLKGEETDLPLYVLASILEDGSASGNLPARLHWAPYRIIVKRDAVRVRASIASQVVKKVKRALFARK